MKEPGGWTRVVVPVEGKLNLTVRQLRALKLAHRRGWFEVPRETSLEELGDEIGISNGALSTRLHNAENAVIEEVLAGAHLKKAGVCPLCICPLRGYLKEHLPECPEEFAAPSRRPGGRSSTA